MSSTNRFLSLLPASNVAFGAAIAAPDTIAVSTSEDVAVVGASSVVRDQKARRSSSTATTESGEQPPIAKTTGFLRLGV